MPLYPSTTPAVLTVRHAFAGKGVDLTCVRSAVRPLGCRSYLCQVDRTTAGAPHTCIRLASCVGSATSTGQLSESMRTGTDQRVVPRGIFLSGEAQETRTFIGSHHLYMKLQLDTLGPLELPRSLFVLRRTIRIHRTSHVGIPQTALRPFGYSVDGQTTITTLKILNGPCWIRI
ncbi:hypothetical protein GW17_00059502 [Ensete ventricosum]|nr:hypothetical protein GW17_00059502 [Ensete ventricosum]